MKTLTQIQTEARQEWKNVHPTVGNIQTWSELELIYLDKVISTTYQAGKDAAVEYIEKSFTFSLDELSKSGAEKLKDILNQARNV